MTNTTILTSSCLARSSDNHRQQRSSRWCLSTVIRINMKKEKSKRHGNCQPLGATLQLTVVSEWQPAGITCIAPYMRLFSTRTKIYARTFPRKSMFTAKQAGKPAGASARTKPTKMASQLTFSSPLLIKAECQSLSRQVL